MSCFEHTMLVIDSAAVAQDPVVTFACLCHDLGKRPVYDLYSKLHGHEEAGVPRINALCDRFRVPTEYRCAAVMAAMYHTKIHNVYELKPTTIVDMLDKIGAFHSRTNLNRLLLVCLHDSKGRGEPVCHDVYNNHLYVNALVDFLCTLDTKAIAKNAIDSGKRGPMVGAAIRSVRIAMVKKFKNENIHKYKEIDEKRRHT